MDRPFGVERLLAYTQSPVPVIYRVNFYGEGSELWDDLFALKPYVEFLEARIEQLEEK